MSNITKDTEWGNTYTFHNLTYGQLLAIKHGLEKTDSVVGYDIRKQIDNLIKKEEEKK